MSTTLWTPEPQVQSDDEMDGEPVQEQELENDIVEGLSSLSFMNSSKPVRRGSGPTITIPPQVNTRRISTGSINISPGWSSKHSIGSPWTVQMSALKFSQSPSEAIKCLHSIESQLLKIDKNDRIKLCKGPFEMATKLLLTRKAMMTTQLFNEVNYLMKTYFDESGFKKLPESIIMEIFLWVPTDEFAQIISVSKEFYHLSTCDIVWKELYLYKFQRHNPNSMPEATVGFKELYHTRLDDPEIGDRVEVSWQGKFRLEALEVYQGRAWWVAEIVDKHTSQGRYKIRYPGWDSRWDEWVAKSRLRWAVDKNWNSRIHPNDIVELWCFGSNVPGAWLEARIKKIRNGKFCVGKVLSTGSLWVDRERLRPVKRVPRDMSDSSSEAGSPVGRSAYALSDRLNQCSIM